MGFIFLNIEYLIKIYLNIISIYNILNNIYITFTKFKMQKYILNFTHLIIALIVFVNQQFLYQYHQFLVVVLLEKINLILWMI